MLTLEGHSGTVWRVGCSPDGERIVSGSADKQVVRGGRDGTVKVWDVETGREVLTLTEHTGEVTSITFSPDGERIVSSSRDTTVKVWDARPWTAEQRAARRAASVPATPNQPATPPDPSPADSPRGK